MKPFGSQIVIAASEVKWSILGICRSLHALRLASFFAHGKSRHWPRTTMATLYVVRITCKGFKMRMSKKSISDLWGRWKSLVAGVIFKRVFIKFLRKG